MKYAAYGLLAAFLASGVYGAIPKTAEGWYTPSEWRPVELEATYERKGVLYGCAINADGEIIWGEGEINNPIEKMALEAAVEAWWKTQRNDQKFEELGRQLADPFAGADYAAIVFGTSARHVILLENRSIDGMENNRAYCPRAKRQRGKDCAAYSFATYLEFLGARNGWGGCRVDPDEMHRYAHANAPQNLKGGTERTQECFDWWTAETRSDNYELAHVWLLGADASGGGADADDVRTLSKCLVRRFGGFIANVAVSDEWHLQNPRCRQVCMEMFGEVPDAICGLDVTVETDSGEATTGNHAVVVYGCDADFVYFENSWGEGWGHAGHCKMTWPEFAREFVFGEVVADKSMLREMLDASAVTQFLSIKRNAHKSCGGHNGK